MIQKQTQLTMQIALLSTIILLGSPALAMSTRPKPSATEQLLTQAEQNASKGKPAAAARSIETLAAQEVDSEIKNRLLLRATQYWLDANDTSQAQRVFDNVGTALPRDDAALRAFIAAQLAMQRQQAVQALAALDQMSLPLPDHLAVDILKLRTQVQFALGRPILAIYSALDRERLLHDATLIAQNRALVLSGLQENAARGIDLRIPPGVSPLVAGWLDYARIKTTLAHNPLVLNDALMQWRQHYPNHPADQIPAVPTVVAPTLPETPPMSIEWPTHIALLLPLSGRQKNAGSAVRDGLLTALFSSTEQTPPQINIYDTVALGAVNAYQQAIAAGATCIIGPLLKEDISALVSAQQIRVPTLALNVLPNPQTDPSLLFKFALNPEEEAQQIATHAVNAAQLRGAVLLPNNEWGQRVLQAFTTTFTAAGGVIVGTELYDPATRDFSNPITKLMLINESQTRARALGAAIGSKLKTVPRARQDADFIFIGAQPQQGRLLRPALHFHITDPNLPVYATSDIYEFDKKANEDLDGISFPDMPWMISTDPKLNALRNHLQSLWPDNMTRRERLYAFGYDAFQLIPLLFSTAAHSTTIAGATGQLFIDASNYVHRQLDWAHFNNGVAVPLLSTPTPQIIQTNTAEPAESSQPDPIIHSTFNN